MRKLFLVVVAAMSLSMGAYAQGFLYLDTQQAGPVINVYDVFTSSATPYANGNLTIQIWIAPTGTLSGEQNSSIYYNLASLGYLDQGLVTVTTDSFGFLSSSTPFMLNDLTTSQSSVPMVMVIWTGPTQFSGNGVIYGFNAINLGFMVGGTITQNAGTGGDASLGGDPSWPNGTVVDITMRPVPEPTTIALGAMGLATLLFRRRK